SVSAAVLVSLLGLFGKNSYSTIGNTAYVSGYLIFNLFFSALLFLRTRSNWRFAYLVPVALMLFQFKNMHTSGAIIGLTVGIFLVILLVGILTVNKKLKYSLLGIFSVGVLALIFLFSQQQAAWFEGSFLRNLTSQKATFQTRLISWEGAAKDFKYHPLLGTGFGNYAIIFDRQFNPKFFDYDRVETYFDRAHNNLIDITSTTGLIGLVTYLSIFVFVLRYLYLELKKNSFRISSEAAGRHNLEIVFVFGLLAAYFIQNLAVFDSLVTYIGLMIMLGFVYWLPKEEILKTEELGLPTVIGCLKNDKREWFALVVILILAVIIIFQFNVKPLRMMTGVISGYSHILRGESEAGITAFKDSLTGTPLDRDGRTVLINLALSSPDLLAAVPSNKLESEYNFIVSLAEKNLQYNPQDNLANLQLAQVYDLGGRIFYQDKVKSQEYFDKAVAQADKAIATSPGRIPVYFSKAQSLFLGGQVDEAINVLNYAQTLNPNFPYTYCRLAQVYIMGDKMDQVKDSLDKCIDGGVAYQLGNANSLMSAAAYLVEQKDYPRAIIVVERLVNNYSATVDIWFNLTKLYLIVGDVDKAQTAAQKTISLDANYQKQVEDLLLTGAAF
ncbi:MAG TPA: O-antigen ligase family protein, partial [Candidatus Saccharimonadales bacterium]|nr:O-antigen ligase family protein [Candidatus Saccharimonadales bacterium]